MGLFGAPGAVDGPSVCSRKGCRETAGWVLRWNNPRIHTPDRRKSWASCELHVAWFEQYLGDRGLWKETVPLRTTSDGLPMGNS
jgi:hypothetical protein